MPNFLMCGQHWNHAPKIMSRRLPSWSNSCNSLIPSWKRFGRIPTRKGSGVDLTLVARSARRRDWLLVVKSTSSPRPSNQRSQRLAYRMLATSLKHPLLKLQSRARRLTFT
ncbi:UNVERIFIED_CONTAM: hypothetical protein Sradi_0710400 [Sesamum radiatum]|uniref:Uncharacterized protein n=1 Tax=Sesamum radiatum TaxID=300843 RepID=A0AAW2VPD4_SESRA